MKIIDVEQGSPEWFAARMGIPTATDFEDIITSVKGDLSAKAEGCINRLIDEMVRPGMQEPTFTGNRHTQRGNELEGRARDWFAFVTGFHVETVGFVTRNDGKAGCSPDGLVSGGPVAGWPLASSFQLLAGLEIKCPDGPTHVGYLRANALPDKYKQQVHGSMVITGLTAWHFVSFCPGYEPLWLPIRWDSYTDKVAAALDQFIARLDDAKANLGVTDHA